VISLIAWAPSPLELIVLLGLGVLLFGKRLPELGRTLGKGIIEFKKGLNGLEDNIEQSSAPRQEIAPEPIRPPQRVTTSAPKFEDAPPASSTPPRV
jgi:sec-independent protein translocase protein TatA